MNSGRMIQGLAWAIAALVSCVALAWLALVVVNRHDEAPSADALRLEALVRDRAHLADADNGYIHLLGLAATPDSDPGAMAIGSARAAYIETYVAPMADDGAHAWPGRDVDYRALRGPDVAALADAAACFNSDQLAALEWTIILINSFNQISIASHHQPRLDD